MTHVTQPPRVTHPHVFARPILWAWFSWRREVTGLEGSPGAEGSLSHSQRAGRSSQSPGLELAITWCCETVTLHYLFTIDICLGKGNGIQCVIFILALSPSLCFCLYLFLLSLYLICLYLSVIHSVCPVLPLSISFFPSASVSSAFLWNVMIHWLWSLWAVSLKSVCLLSATTEWYITSITCNFLSFIRYIYSPYNGEDCSFLQPNSEYLSLTPRPCSWKPLSGVGMCQD